MDGRHARNHGEVLADVSEGLVRLLKEYYGRGPHQARAYYHDDLVVCVLRGGFSRIEDTLIAHGRTATVMQQRMEFQDIMRDRFKAVVEAATGREVLAFMSGNHQGPDMMCEVFILRSSEPRRGLDPLARET